MRVINLGSGSKGNETFIQAGNVKILVDVGFNLKDTIFRLGLIGEKVEDLDVILITHEHRDHISGLIPLMKSSKARVYIHEDILKGYLKIDDSSLLERISPITYYPFNVGDVKITPFYLPHDSVRCLGYRVDYKEKSVCFATDLGYVPPLALETMFGASLIYIESNHDRSTLLACRYPYIVKQRIMSERGHLSNEQAAAAIVTLAKHGTKHFVLSHISQNSNTEQLAFLATAKALEDAGFELEKDVFVRYSRQDKPGNNFNIGDD